MRLPKGKIPAETLKKTVFRHLGAERKDVLLGPSLGEDGSVIKIGEKVLISAMDPITGASERIGWLAVHINANDVATFGVQPEFFSSCILLPEDSTEDMVDRISNQIDEAAKSLNIAVIGGHSEITPDLERPIVVGCAMGVTDDGQYVTSGGSIPGDKLILTKGAGIEGTAILASEAYHQLRKKMDEHCLKSALGFYDRISVVKDAILAFNVGGVNAMHDPTEGGVAGGIHEMADAANLGVKVFEDKIPTAEETLMICNFFHIDPLQLISSGALLISADPQSADEILEKLRRQNIQAAIIGEFLKNPKQRLLISADDKIKELIRPISDHLWIALEKCDSPV